jgi:hypothetical protein
VPWWAQRSHALGRRTSLNSDMHTRIGAVGEILLGIVPAGVSGSLQLAVGRTVSEIAEELLISVKTVSTPANKSSRPRS